LPIPSRGDIYHIEIAEGECVGRELKGGHWWVVLSNEKLNAFVQLFTAVPLTSVLNKNTGIPKDEGNFRFFKVRVLSTSKKNDPGRKDKIFEGDSIALTEQARTLSVERITEPRAGTVDGDGLAAIEAGLLFVINARISRQPSVELPAQLAHTAPRVVVPAEPPRPLPGKPLDPKSK